MNFICTLKFKVCKNLRNLLLLIRVLVRCQLTPKKTTVSKWGSSISKCYLQHPLHLRQEFSLRNKGIWIAQKWMRVLVKNISFLYELLLPNNELNECKENSKSIWVIAKIQPYSSKNQPPTSLRRFFQSSPRKLHLKVTQHPFTLVDTMFMDLQKPFISSWGFHYSAKMRGKGILSRL